MAKAKTVKKAAARTPAKKAPATKAKAARAKPAPAAGAKGGVFDAIEALPTGTFGASRAPTWAVSERAAALLGLGYPNFLVPSSASYTGTDAELHELFELCVVPRDAVDKLRKAATDSETRRPLADEAEATLQFGGPHVLHVLEAAYGAEETARVFVEQLASYPVEEWSGGDKLENYGWAVIRMLYFTLLRVPPKLRTQLRAMLEKVFAKVSKGTPEEWWRPVQALDVILHGRVGVERSGKNFNGTLHLRELIFADDDPAWVASQVIGQLKTLKPADREVFDLQLAVVGGDKVLAALKSSVAKFPSDQKKSIAAQLSLAT